MKAGRKQAKAALKAGETMVDCQIMPNTAPIFGVPVENQRRKSTSKI
jgi:hypothetical protein